MIICDRDYMEINKENFDKQADRNLLGIKHEKEGNIDVAIELYEQNIKENFDGNHPYDRLAIIYRKRNQIDDEIRVLNKAIYVFSNLISPRKDIKPKLEKFKERLAQASKLLDK